MQGKVQSAVERETREGGVGSRPGGPACQSGEDGTHHGALRDRSKTIREVRPSSSLTGGERDDNIVRDDTRGFFVKEISFFFFFFEPFESSLFRSGLHLVD